MGINRKNRFKDLAHETLINESPEGKQKVVDVNKPRWYLIISIFLLLLIGAFFLERYISNTSSRIVKGKIEKLFTSLNNRDLNAVGELLADQVDEYVNWNNKSRTGVLDEIHNYWENIQYERNEFNFYEFRTFPQTNDSENTIAKFRNIFHFSASGKDTLSLELYFTVVFDQDYKIISYTTSRLE